MYKRVKKLLSLAPLFIVPILLSGCGGGGGDDESTGSSTSAPNLNKPVLSSAGSSTTSATSFTPTTSSAKVTFTTSSETTRSAVQSYSPTSTASVSSASHETPPPFDFLAPDAPKLRLYRLSDSSITLAWDRPFDNVGISHYKIARDGQFVGTTEGSTNIMVDKNLATNTGYTYVITALDFAGNESGSSAPLYARTLADLDGVIVSSAAPSSRSSSTLSSSPHTAPSSRASSTSLFRASSSKQSSSLIPSSVANSAQISSRAPSSANTTSVVPASSRPSSSSSSAPAVMPSSSAKSSSSISSISNSKLIRLTWSHPNQRENGTYLTLEEIKGYEIRFKQPADRNYIYMVLNGNRTTSFTTDLIPLTSIIEIAVYDSAGLYSAFAPITAEPR